ncbi:hypothetical protein ZIOFF_063284 [Zingiber officinale]|uniref:Uncharacterized protein n=1 Tax=Zingiber officinale TaxID=94328 RepID=A0A8J5F1Q8_ZINOF|nr:hypothetical protein ZIOFF_063284 [Zingiber officinale]
MRSSCSLLQRTLSLRPKFAPSPVSPWPPVRTAFDRWLMSELDELRLVPFSVSRYTSGHWLAEALDLTFAAQRMTVRLLATPAGRTATHGDRQLIEGYADGVVELLDACNGLRERIGELRKYTGSMYVASHYLDKDPRQERISSGVAGRATVALAECEATEKRCDELDKLRDFNLRKLGEKIAGNAEPAARDHQASADASTAELREALRGTLAMTQLAVAATWIAVSFNARRGLPAAQPGRQASGWGGKLRDLHKAVKEEFEKRRKGGAAVLDELEAAASCVRSLRRAVARGAGREVGLSVRLARRSGRELEERMRSLGQSVDQVYSQLIRMRVMLLDKLTGAKTYDIAPPECMRKIRHPTH